MSVAVVSTHHGRARGALADVCAAEPDRVNWPSASAGGPERLLLIDRDRQLSMLLAELLRAHGYAVRMAEEAEWAEDPARGPRLDLIIVDFGDSDRVRCLRRLCQRACSRVLVLSAHMDEADRIALLENGAEDCLSKPFNPRELLLRVRTVLRRRTGSTPQDDAMTLRVGPLSLNAVAQTLTIGTRDVELTGAESRALKLLMLNAGRAVVRDHLTEYALGRAASPYERSLDTHISNLRGKLGRDARGGMPIKTLRGVGYLLLPLWEPACPLSAERLVV